LARFLIFLPSILALSATWLICYIYLQSTIKQLGKENLNNPQWQKENSKKILPAIYIDLFIHVPVAEELMFRAPIILIFDKLSYNALYGVVISAIIFAFMHYVRNPFDPKQKWPKDAIFARVFMSFIGGLIYGYLGIYCQSIYASVIAHALWNVRMSFPLFQKHFRL